MPSSATTGVTIGTILDLIGPSAQSPSAGKDQPAFDSLLQPPPPPSPAPPSPEAADEHSKPQRSDDSSDSSNPPSPTPAADEHAGDSSHDAPQRRPESASNNATPSRSASAKPERDAAEKQEQPHDADEVIVESLTGLAAAPPPAVVAAASAEAKPAEETNDPEPSDAAVTAGKPKSGRAQPTVAQVVPLNPVADAAKGDTPSQPGSDSPVQAVQKSVVVPAGEQHTTEKASPAEVAKSTHSTDAQTDKSTDSSTTDARTVDLANADGSQKDAQPAANPQHESPQNTEAPVINASALTSQAADSAAATAASAPPVVAPPAAQLPIVDPGQNATSSAPDNSLTSAAAAPRSRRPADVLTQSTSGPNRHGSVEVDATRLLTRVARAFTAAQERDGEIRLRLSPPELGSLRLDVRVQDGVLVARMQTETAAARTAILDNLPALRDRLSEQGVRIERFDVDLMQRQHGGMPDQPGGRQPDLPAAPVRVAPPPRLRPEAAVPTIPSSRSVGSADGLNVIV